ncbi:MAG TPA: PaaI family thioesterase [Sulfurimonas sp.]|nr:PaaI family thioesterase [Sulfurimonas sp.]
MSKESFNFLDYIGCVVEVSDEDGAVLSIQIKKEHLQHLGYIHGGVISTLADNTGWFVLEPHLKLGQTAMTQELTLNYLRPGKGKNLKAVGKLIKLGKTMGFVNVEVFCDDVLICTSSSHLAILNTK